MSLLGYFVDWQTKTASFEELSTTTNSAGQPVDTWSVISGAESVPVNFWTDSSRKTDVNDRFVDQATGTVLVDPADIDFEPDTTMRMEIDSKYYYIVGVDDVAGFDEVYVLNWRREV